LTKVAVFFFSLVEGWFTSTSSVCFLNGVCHHNYVLSSRQLKVAVSFSLTVAQKDSVNSCESKSDSIESICHKRFSCIEEYSVKSVAHYYVSVWQIRGHFSFLVFIIVFGVNFPVQMLCCLLRNLCLFVRKMCL